MGCDIHSMIEVLTSPYKTDLLSSETGAVCKYWHSAGDPMITRNYELFAVLGNVRNDDDPKIPFIGELRLNPDYIDDWAYTETSPEFAAWARSWGADGHSHSYVTLAEMRAYNVNQTVYSHRLVTARDENGRITSTCGATSGEHMGEVGEVNIFGPWGHAFWDDLIRHMVQIRDLYNVTDNDIRLVFFFDN